MKKCKITEKNGETLVEVLVSVLISALAVLMLINTIMVAARINKSSEDSNRLFREELMKAEKHDNTTKSTDSSSLKIHPVDTALPEYTISGVYYYGDTIKSFVFENE